MQVISLFSGIGGFEIAAEQVGWDIVSSCEINPFGQRVLKYYWPDAYHHGDIHTFTNQLLNEQVSKRYGTHWRESTHVVLCGGFP